METLLKLLVGLGLVIWFIPRYAIEKYGDMSPAARTCGLVVIVFVLMYLLLR